MRTMQRRLQRWLLLPLLIFSTSVRCEEAEHRESTLPSVALLEFLVEFEGLDEEQFELLLTFADKDAAREAKQQERDRSLSDIEDQNDAQRHE